MNHFTIYLYTYTYIAIITVFWELILSETWKQTFMLTIHYILNSCSTNWESLLTSKPSFAKSFLYEPLADHYLVCSKLQLRLLISQFIKIDSLSNPIQLAILILIGIVKLLMEASSKSLAISTGPVMKQLNNKSGESGRDGMH